MNWIDGMRRDLFVEDLRALHRENPHGFWQAMRDEDSGLLETMVDRLRERLAVPVKKSEE